MAHTDISHDHWTLRLLPRGLKPYGRLMRVDRPIGWWLLLLPCWWSLLLAWRTQPELATPGLTIAFYASLFWIGAVVMRGAGCVTNDLWDRDIDAKVERTTGRPIPSGEVSPKQALLFIGILLVVGLAVLMQFNTATVLWGLGSLVLVLIYPLAKRVTYWPQFVLGLAFNWGALVGWVAVTGSIAWAPVLMYVAGIFWTLGYDTIYAHQDKEDDLIVGVKSTALKFGDKTKLFLTIFSVLQAVFMLFCGQNASVSLWFYASIGASLVGFLVLLARVDINSPAQCIGMFKAQLWIGLIMVFGCLMA